MDNACRPGKSGFFPLEGDVKCISQPDMLVDSALQVYIRDAQVSGVCLVGSGICFIPSLQSRAVDTASAGQYVKVQSDRRAAPGNSILKRHMLPGFIPIN